MKLKEPWKREPEGRRTSPYFKALCRDPEVDGGLTKLKILDMEKWVDLKTMNYDDFLLQQRPPIV